MDKKKVESWLIDRGVETEEVKRSFREGGENGEVAVTVSRLHEHTDYSSGVRTSPAPIFFGLG